jgi:hypothetical protein
LAKPKKGRARRKQAPTNTLPVQEKNASYDFTAKNGSSNPGANTGTNTAKPDEFQVRLAGNQVHRREALKNISQNNPHTREIKGRRFTRLQRNEITDELMF